MKKIWLAFGLALAGCTSTPQAYPNFMNGRYYMVGDTDCRYSANVTPTRILCYDEQRQAKGYRDALTDQQLMMYQSDQLIAAQQRRRYTTTQCNPLGGGVTCNTF
ncbi:hypothetical protein [Mesorhizobium sp. CN2-181]|uniref:hypothetical protein n=1 Tax=Mesorhizobium yinganensis TaxID=3157707 RepID=UPI0032B7B7D0